MKNRKRVLASLLTLGLLAGSAASQASGWCDSGKPVKFAGLNWESGMLLTDIMMIVLKDGYGCTTDQMVGNTIILETALAGNDIQVFGEEWMERSEVWKKAAAAGKVIGVGGPIVGGTQGWYVPRYVVEGDKKRNRPAQAPELKSVADLSKYPTVFKDSEEPSKGRFYNCPAGWICEQDNTEMLKEYGLENTFTNFRPGTGAALDAAVLSSYKRGEPVLFYYWSPTPLMGQIDAIRLEEKPGVDKNVVTMVGLSSTFHQQAPELVSVLEKVNIPIELLNQNLARMTSERIESPKLARIFLKEHPEVWHAWVDETAAKKIEASL
ncbi:histidine ABC transporter substrate-binding protein [Pseudomonas putida]|uniref:Histidine ABC transporter substrate-binding protein n=1 Tax=Pseudomonas putida TaxID=303 RepID=A0A2Z4RSR2_PSEPU|nr:glycine betaine ABC transporter substrate-binding protein [Pseudomonas putida]AWY44089.1 histidine ABC transporter substrate-binding protein [Pseudomonas putida]